VKQHRKKLLKKLIKRQFRQDISNIVNQSGHIATDENRIPVFVLVKIIHIGI